MAEYISFRDGGKSNEEGISRLLQKISGTQNKGIIGTADMAATQNGTPNMTVNVAVGDIVIPYSSYQFNGWIDAVKNVTVNAADPSNPRIDRVVAYVDLSVVSSTNSNNPGALKFKAVPGTPAGSPVRPIDATVQTSVGSGNPFIDVADLAVSAADTSIVTGDITDKRIFFQLGSGIGGIMLAQAGTVSVANNVTSIVVVPKSGFLTKIYAQVKTAPTGASLNIRVNKNGVSATTLNIAAGATTANATGLSISFAAGDYFTLDITQIGSGVAGADLTVVLG